MIKNKIKIFMAVIASIICMGAGMIIGTQSNAAVKNNPNSNVKGWNISAPETTRAPGSAFTYNVYPSTNKKSAWIYHIDVDPNMDYSTLNIPQTINGMTVTRLGWVYVPSKNDDFLDTDEFNQTIFGAIVEQCHGASGSYIPLGDNLRNRTYISMSVSSITIPNTVTQLQESTFSGIVNLREITIPDGVSVIPAELFYGCSSLESVKLPKALNSIDPSAFTDCHKLQNMELSNECQTFKIMNKSIVNKNDMSLVYCYASGDKYNIPKGIKTLKTFSFTNCTAKNIHIPASVKKIEQKAFHRSNGYSSRNISNMTVSKKNKVYAKDGQTIYNKKNKTLTVAIITGKPDETKYVMSNKVKKLTICQSTINMDEWEEAIENLYVSKNLKKVGFRGFGVVFNANNVYYTSKKVPKLLKTNKTWSPLPIFTNIHVLKEANAEYKKLYKKHHCLGNVDKWNTY